MPLGVMKKGQKGKPNENGRTHIFIQLFVDRKFWGYTFLAHNAKGWDGWFVVGQLLKVKSGYAVLSAKALNSYVWKYPALIYVSLTLNFPPMKLSSPSQGFLHFFNTAEKQIYVGPPPPLEYYGVHSVRLEEEKQFSA